MEVVVSRDPTEQARGQGWVLLLEGQRAGLTGRDSRPG